MVKCRSCGTGVDIKAVLESPQYVWRCPLAIPFTCKCGCPYRLLLDNGEVSLAEWLGFPPAENWQEIPGTKESIAAKWIVDAFEVIYEGQRYVYPRQ